MCWVIEYECGKSIYMNDVFVLYHWGGDNGLVLSRKKHQTIFSYF